MLDAIAELDETKIIEHFKSDEIQQIRVHHKCEIERLTQHLEDLRASINKVIDALGPDARSVEIRAFFDEKAEQIQRTKLDIAANKRELAESAPPTKIAISLQRHQKLVAKLRAWSRDPEAVASMRQLIKRLTLVSRSESPHNSICLAEFDLQTLTAIKGKG